MVLNSTPLSMNLWVLIKQKERLRLECSLFDDYRLQLLALISFFAIS